MISCWKLTQFSLKQFVIGGCTSLFNRSSASCKANEGRRGCLTIFQKWKFPTKAQNRFTLNVSSSKSMLISPRRKQITSWIKEEDHGTIIGNRKTGIRTLTRISLQYHHFLSTRRQNQWLDFCLKNKQFSLKTFLYLIHAWNHRKCASFYYKDVLLQLDNSYDSY